MSNEEADERPIFRPFTRESFHILRAKIAEIEAKKHNKSEQHNVADDVYDAYHGDDERGPNAKLEGGLPLPRPLQRQFTESLTATPIEEIDEYYAEMGIPTFVVISKGRDIWRFSATKSLFIFDPFHPLRRVAIYMLVHPWFSFLVIVTILVNCILMTLNPTKTIEQTEIIFTTVYTFESCLKVTARGFILTKFTYLRDPWNWLDFVVIVLAYVTMFAESLGNLSALRTFRVLRALKTVAIIPGMKTIVGAVIESVKNLKDVIILTCFSLSVFALLGLQIYIGVLTHVCIENGPSDMTDEEWYAWNSNESHHINHGDEQKNLCSNSTEAQTCKGNTTCLAGFAKNPNYGYTNFDSFNWALLCAFRLMTQDAWESLYQMVLRATGPYHIVFFMAAIFLGSIYLINLILAIVAMSYDDLQRKNQDEEREMLQEEEAFLMSKRHFEPDEQTNPSSYSHHRIEPNFNIHNSCESLNCSVYSAPAAANRHKHLQRALSQTDKSGTSDTTNTCDRRDSLSLPGSPFQSERLTANSNCDTKTNSVEHHLSADIDPCNKQNGANIMNNYNYLQSRHSNYTSNSSRISYSSHGDIYNKGSPSIKNNGLMSLQNLHGYYTPKDVFDIDDYLMPSNRKQSGNPFLEKSSHSEIDNLNAGETHHHEMDLMTSDDKDDDYEEEEKEPLKVRLLNFFMKAIDMFCIWDCCWCWIRLQELFALIVFDPFMELFITLCIVVNTLFMAMDHHEMDPEFSHFLDVGNTFFTTTFAIEAFLKLIALSPKFYFREGWNIFDFLIVALSLMEKAFEGISGFSVLRTFRLLRVFKLAKSWPTLNLLITIMGKAMGSLGNLTFVLGIIIFIFAVMGNQLFGKSYQPHKFPAGVVPRWHFKDFMHSFMIVFRVLCGEWIESMWDCMHVHGPICIPFFLATVIIGNLVVLSLFLALLLSSFGASNLSAPTSESTDTKKLQEAFERFARAQKWIKNRILGLFKARNRISDQTLKNGINIKDTNESQITKLNVEEETENIGCDAEISQANRGRLHNNAVTVLNSIKVANAMKAQENAVPHESTALTIEQNCERHEDKNADVEHVDVTNNEMAVEDVEIVEYPADCFSESFYQRFPCCLQENEFWNRWKSLRCSSYKLVENKYFETLVITLILISSLTLALEDVHLKEKDWLIDILYYVDKFFTVIFFFEMVLKWFAYGFKYYFSNAWCWLDFIIVMVSVLNFGAELLQMNKVQAFKTMRTLRALRPLRAMSRMQGMKVVVNALVQAIPAIFNVLLVCLIFWLIFAIMGVQFFNGKFEYCRTNDTKIIFNATDVPNRNVCYSIPNAEWHKPKINFDNVPNAYLALFQVATWKGWLPIMDHAVDTQPLKYMQPIYESNIYMYIYFVFFIIFGSFFTLNLFIGVIIDNFNEQKKKTGGSMELFMSEDQKKYYNAMKKMGKRKPIKAIPRPRLKLQAIAFDITTNKKFDMTIMAFIMMNMVVMCLDTFQAPKMYATVLERLNLFFVAIFTAECVLKLFALRWYYFKEPWNVFDFVIVILSILGSILKEWISRYFVSPTMLRVVRVVKIGRVLRLVKGARGIRTLLFALAMSLPALFNICLLLFLVMFIYAIFGMSFFMNVKYRAGIDETFNFGTFFKSFILLFQMCTSAGWSEVLEALMTEDDCDKQTDESPGNCGNYGVAIAYLISYLVITFLVIINMYIAVILENYSQATEDVNEGLTDDDYDMYYEIWQKFDPKGTQFIHYSQLSDLCDTLEVPLQIPKPNKYKIVNMEVPIYTGDLCFCVDILNALTKNFFVQNGRVVEETNELQEIVPRKGELQQISTTLWRQQEDRCARVIQDVWKRWRNKRQQLELQL